jgi:hypothetical protein
MILGVTYDEIMVQSRYDGPMSDLLIKANARRGLRINTTTLLYLMYYDQSMTFDHVPSILEGTEVHIADVEKNKRVVGVKLETMPSSKASDNVYHENMTIALSTDKTKVQQDCEYSIKGHFENTCLFDFTSWVDFLAEDHILFPY